MAPGPSAGSAAQRATQTIPIVVNTSDPVEQGLIAGFAQPGRNITGMSLLSAELVGKQLELLKEAVPQLARVAVLANPSMPGLRFRIHSLTETARVLGLRLHVRRWPVPPRADRRRCSTPRRRSSWLQPGHRGAGRSDCGLCRRAPAARDVPLEISAEAGGSCPMGRACQA